MREGVGEVKGDMLGDAGAFKMREISAAMPPGRAVRSTNLLIGGFYAAVYDANREIGVPGAGWLELATSG